MQTYDEASGDVRLLKNFRDGKPYGVELTLRFTQQFTADQLHTVPPQYRRAAEDLLRAAGVDLPEPETVSA